MNAVRLVAPREPLELCRLDLPPIGERDVLVRVGAAGICHSDAHYRAGRSSMTRLPITLGHEIAGRVERVGPAVTRVAPGDRVCLHYLITCGECADCQAGREQFCARGAMLGHHLDGGYAEFVAVPERNAVTLPDAISLAHGAVMMCSSATSYHALRKGRLAAGERVAVFGAGGLGMSAVQLARALGASQVFAVDVDRGKLQLAATFGAVAIDAASVDPVAEVRRLTGGRGVDVALEVIGLPQTIAQAIRSLAPLGRAVIAGITREAVAVDTYRDVLGPEAEIIGSNDHLLSELDEVIALVARGALDLSRIVARSVPLDAEAINGVLDRLDRFAGDVRTVIVPE